MIRYRPEFDIKKLIFVVAMVCVDMFSHSVVYFEAGQTCLLWLILECSGHDLIQTAFSHHILVSVDVFLPSQDTDGSA